MRYQLPEPQVHPPVLDTGIEKDIAAGDIAEALVEAGCVELCRQRNVVYAPFDRQRLKREHDRASGAPTTVFHQYCPPANVGVLTVVRQE